MSNLIFPDLPGNMNVRRALLNNTTVQQGRSGQENRITRWSVPRYRYEVKFDFLRSDAAIAEVQSVASFIQRHQGRKESFLFKDWYDNAVTAHGFGVGTGAATSFQLQRTAGGVFTDSLGSWPAYTTPRYNYFERSQDFSDAVWSKANISVVAGAAIAPDGSATAAKFVEAASNTQHYSQQGSLAVTANGMATFSVYARPNGRDVLVLTGSTPDVAAHWASFNVATGTTYSQNNCTSVITPAPGGWYRCAITYSVGAVAGNSAGMIYLNLYGAYLGDGVSGLFLWGAQMETGTVATQPIATAATGATASPAYWPTPGDGFEPVYDPVWSGVSIYKDGVVVVPGTGSGGWTPGANGAVVFGTAPASASALSWSGSYLRRVRCNDDELELQEIVPGYLHGTLELESVLP